MISSLYLFFFNISSLLRTQSANLIPTSSRRNAVLRRIRQDFKDAKSETDVNQIKFLQDYAESVNRQHYSTSAASKRVD